MLSAHSRLSCGPETSFFAALSKQSTDNLLQEAAWPERAVEFLYSIRLGGEPIPDRFGLDRQQIATYLSESGPSVSAILEALTDQFRLAQGKERWVEKSPIHLLHTTAIRRYFPASPIVRIVRDARDVALSLLKVPWGPDSYPSGLLYWRRFEHGSARFFDSSKHHTWSLRYEDLVRDPETQLRGICGYLDEEYEASMLDFAETSAGLRMNNETWKGNVGRQLDSSRAEVWRTTLSASQKELATALVEDRLRIYDYPTIGEGRVNDRYLFLQPTTEEVEGFETTLESQFGNGARCWPFRRFETPDALLLLGHPEENGWLGQGRMTRLLRTFEIGGRLVIARLTGRPVLWKVQRILSSSQGFCEGFLRSIAGILRIRPTLEPGSGEDPEQSQHTSRRAS